MTVMFHDSADVCRRVHLHLRQKRHGGVMSRFQNCCLPGLLLATLIAAGAPRVRPRQRPTRPPLPERPLRSLGRHSRWGSIK